MTDFQTASETELREAEAPTFNDIWQLANFIEDLEKRDHDYGTCVYAMSLSATAAFNYIASKLGVTGFQAGCADFDILRRTRSLECFIIIDLENALYPQYDLHARLEQSLEEIKPWLRDKAKEKLAEKEDFAHHDVIRHWKELAAYEEPVDASSE